ncbi:MAG: glycosyltransferase [Peptococcaceae bacterium]|jgi:glycosyltransferase involved in cell wall biosynthesis|nr:glycosyltransferase [Peptococcaceae bacterium]
MPKLTAMMIVRNEAERYLQGCLDSLVKYTDSIVVLDDASEDNTPEICLTYHNVKLFRHRESTFLDNEAQLRHKLWHYTQNDRPEWILAIDADEFLEEEGIKEIPYLLKQKHFNAVSFRLFDCWEREDYYRTDGLWNPWLRGFSIYMVRYLPQLSSAWPSLKFHCGRFPVAYRQLPHYESSSRIKHLGWANTVYNRAKYERALLQDPACQYMSKEHYDSILWPPEKVKLEKWIERSSI